MDIKWHPEMMLEIELNHPENFLKVKETLTRIGIPSKKEHNKLFQSCHILHKQGKYYILHFLELFALDGRREFINEQDILRRNTIAFLLQEWGLVTIKKEPDSKLPISSVKIISYKDKENWELLQKYTIGVRH